MRRSTLPWIAVTILCLPLFLSGCFPASPGPSGSEPAAPLRIVSRAVVSSNVNEIPESSEGVLALDVSLSRTSSHTLIIDATVTNVGRATYSLVDPGVSVVLILDDGRELISDIGFNELPPGGYSPAFGSEYLDPGDSANRHFVTAALAESTDATITISGAGSHIEVGWAQVPVVSR